MANIDVIHTTLGTEVSSSSTSFTEVVESDDLVDGSTYYVICHALCEGSTNSDTYEWRLYDNTNGEVVEGSTMKREPATANKTQSYTFVGKVVAGASGGGVAFEQKSPALLKTVKTQFVSMVFMELSNLQSSDYFFDSDFADEENTDEWAATLSQIVATPTSGDTWLVMGWVSTEVSSVTEQSEMRLHKEDDVATTLTPTISYEGEANREYLNWWVCRAYVTDDSSTRYQVQVRDSADIVENNNTLGTSIFGLRLNAFENFAANYTDAATTTTATSWQEIDSLELTPDSTNTVVAIASAVFEPETTGRPALARLQVDGATSPNSQANTYHSARSNDGGDLLPLPYVTTYSGSADTEATIDFDTKKTTSADIGWKEYSVAAFSTVIAETETAPVNYSAIASQTFSSGDVASQAYNSGDVASHTFGSGDVASEVNPS